MRITDIRLYQFRNHERLQFSPTEGLQYIRGENAIGKTNILEAIYLALGGDYLRSATEKDLIQGGKENAQIALSVQEDFKRYDIDVRIFRNKNKELYLNGERMKSIKEWTSLFPVTSFTPEDLRIVKEGPHYRRKMMDQMSARCSKIYMDTLYQYRRYILHRNTLLKQPKDRHFMTQLNALDYQLIQLGMRIVDERKKLEKKLQEIAPKIHEQVTDGREKLTVFYEADIPYDEDKENQKQIWIETLSSHLDKDIQYKNTGRGPHKDELALFVNEKPLRLFGSQGQQRTAVLSLKLAEAEIVKSETGKNPILLFDDIFSELDPKRQELVKEKINEQAFFTMTDAIEKEQEKAQVWTLKENSVLIKERL